MQETQVRLMGWKDPLEKEMATHSSLLAWRVPRTEEPGGLQSMGSQRVGHDLGTKQLWGQNEAGCVNSLEQGWDIVRTQETLGVISIIIVNFTGPQMGGESLGTASHVSG